MTAAPAVPGVASLFSDTGEHAFNKGVALRRVDEHTGIHGHAGTPMIDALAKASADTAPKTNRQRVRQQLTATELVRLEDCAAG